MREFAPRKRVPRLTRLGLVLAALLVALCLGGLLAATGARADDQERYVPSARSGRDAVRDLAEQHFAPELVGWAVETAGCETGGTFDLYAHSWGFDRRLGVWYDFHGALQVDAVTWAAKAWELFGATLEHPDVNFAMAAWILGRQGPGAWPWCGR